MQLEHWTATIGELYWSIIFWASGEGLVEHGNSFAWMNLDEAVSGERPQEQVPLNWFLA